METFTDPRDGETYKAVRIGDLLWFAENLRYQGVEHCFPDRDSDNVQKYGCLYTWENAKLACPKGWRLPLALECLELIGGTEYNKWYDLSPDLSSVVDTKLLAGRRYCDDCYCAFNYESSIWTLSSCIKGYAYDFNVTKGCARILSDVYGGHAFSARCVKEASND